MEPHVWNTRLSAFEPIFLAGSAVETFRVLEKSGRAACDVAHYEGPAEEETIAQVRTLLETARANPVQPFFRLSVHVFQEVLMEEGGCHALAALVHLMGGSGYISITIHSDQPSRDWSVIEAKLKFLREKLQNLKVYFEMVAPFGDEFAQAQMESLFNLGLRVKFAAGWTRGCPPGGAVPIDFKALRAFSEFGFRTVIEWYAHAGNLAQFEEQIPDLLSANMNSGFSLPLVSENPYYKFGSGCPPLPNSLDYCRTLARVSRQYPHYDEVFSPLVELALLIKDGGWNYELNIPTRINILVDADGQVKVYRQSPALALTWTTISEASSASSDALRDSFLELVRTQWAWTNVPYCCECRWRYICGGLGTSANGPATTEELDTLCEHRKLFLEHFATIRVADQFFGKSHEAGLDSEAQ